MSTQAALAAFDVDGTLIRGDSYLRYLVFVLVRRPSRWLRAPLLGVAVLLFAVGARSNTWLKTFFLRHVLATLDPQREMNLTRAFVAILVRERLKPGGVRRLREHRAAGDTVILLSAGLESYLTLLGGEVGADAVLSTMVERDAAGRITGRLQGENCYGPSKVERLQAFRSDRAAGERLYAYSDHASDLPLLLHADVPVAIDPDPRLRSVCAQHGIAVETWL